MPGIVSCSRDIAKNKTDKNPLFCGVYLHSCVFASQPYRVAITASIFPVRTVKL